MIYYIVLIKLILTGISHEPLSRTSVLKYYAPTISSIDHGVWDNNFCKINYIICLI